MSSPEERINVLEQRADKMQEADALLDKRQTETASVVNKINAVLLSTDRKVASLESIVDAHEGDQLAIEKRLEALEAPPPPNPVLVKLKAGWAKLKAKLPSWPTLAVLAMALFFFAKAQGCNLPDLWPTPTPGPGPGPAPIPQSGLRVLIIEETADRTKETSAILGSQAIRAYVAEKCAKGPDGKTPEFRVYDKDVVGESEVWIAAMARPRQSLPWLIVSDGKKGFEGPLPQTSTAPAETLAILKKYGG